MSKALKVSGVVAKYTHGRSSGREADRMEVSCFS